MEWKKFLWIIFWETFYRDFEAHFNTLLSRQFRFQIGESKFLILLLNFFFFLFFSFLFLTFSCRCFGTYVRKILTLERYSWATRLWRFTGATGIPKLDMGIMISLFFEHFIHIFGCNDDTLPLLKTLLEYGNFHVAIEQCAERIAGRKYCFLYIALADSINVLSNLELHIKSGFCPPSKNYPDFFPPKFFSLNCCYL